MITKDDLADVMALPVALFPSFRFERPQLEVYYELLRDLDITKQELFEAMKKTLQTSDFFPTVAQIRSQFIQTPTPPAYEALELPRSERTNEWAQVARGILSEARQRGANADLSDFGKEIE